MEAPKCKLCSERHWGTCMKFMDKTSASLRSLIKKVDSGVQKATVDTETGEIKGAATRPAARAKATKAAVKKRPPQKAAEDKKQGWARKKYNKYQRELMRKRREEARLKRMDAKIAAESGRT